MTVPEIREVEKRYAAGYGFETKVKEYVPRRHSCFYVNCRFDQLSQEEYSAFALGALAEIGLWREKEGSETLEYFYGSIINDFSKVPEKASKAVLEEGTYAVFATEAIDMTKEGSTEFMFRVMDLTEEIYDEWLEENGEYAFDDSRIPYEFYGAESADNTNVVMNIYIPVKKL